MTKIVAPRAGDKVARDKATRGEGKVYLGDAAPVLHKITPRPVRAGDKVARDEATRGEGKVYLGDAAPVVQK
jgi:hypothetical protein